MSAVIEKIAQNYTFPPNAQSSSTSPESSPSTVGTFIKMKGYADLVVGVLLAFKPSLLYESPPMQFWHSLTGLDLSDASTAVGFNHAIACMVFAIGLGNIVAARSGPAAWPSVFVSTFIWGVLSLLTALTAVHDVTKEWGVANATMIMTGINHMLFCGAMWYLDREIWNKAFWCAQC
ncbi:hypothetical protein Moror_10512 [Moniliophthora roreri MCA 2997]|uniref:Uncharacterized protein n=1 Tax=Moniliophthora roreri (strain MCA 2997) TaxID=1381753 RepID=V2XH62_MONRO|nr:hypothetical protein Moror_10512 [Moniliophthora roreri MCA 2997]